MIYCKWKLIYVKREKVSKYRGKAGRIEMNLSFQYFWTQITQNPLLMVAVVLTLGVILVNGSTDAPNAIATCVTTRCMSAQAALIMAAVFNFLGVFVMSMINATVAQTITNLVDLGADSHVAIVALSAALFAIVVFSAVAWFFGLPTSQSHALVAGLTGSAIAIHGNLSGVSGAEWLKVVYGLVISVVMGFCAGWLVCKAVEFLFRKANRRRTDVAFRYAQIFAAASMSFMHGAQDGQKFMGAMLLSLFLANGQSTSTLVQMPIWLMLICSLVMGLGTAISGKKIIKSVGMDMVKLEKYQGFSADIAASICLLISSIFGIPVSSTHAKTTAIMGVGVVRRLSAINFSVVKEMAMTWILTFPGCGIIAFIITKVFLWIF